MEDPSSSLSKAESMDYSSIFKSDSVLIVIMPREDSDIPMEEAGGDGGTNLRLVSGTCPDPKCQTKLYCVASYTTIDCTGCGQRHDIKALQNSTEEKGDIYNTALFAIKSIIAGVKPEPGTDHIKVHGLSNYMCKLLSHMLSYYGMDKSSGRAKLLTEMGQSAVFDCGVLCDRAFCIDPEQINISGYGRDGPGSASYLEDTLNVVKEHNGKEERLVPIHADGDGHCLVHAISRALVGRELFWHPLRLNLLHHLEDNLDRYKTLFENFVDVDEWDDIISECKPDFVPKEGELAGLRNIHIFGLANVLKRPIILLDNRKGIESCADYTGVFLPALLTPDQCKNKNGTLNPPLCIAWSSQGHNHFIPLVGIKDKPCPLLPHYMLQTTWGVDPVLLDQYITFKDGCCTIGGSRVLQESYIQRLVSAMDEVFLQKYSVHAALVADVHQHLFKLKGFVGVTLEMVIGSTQMLIKDDLLLRCVRCGCLTALSVESKMLRRGGELYELTRRKRITLKEDQLYTFKDHEISCQYDPEKDVLVPDITLNTCFFCKGEGKLRYVNGDGTVAYLEEDVTLEPAGPNSKCSCGLKHFYGGKLYDERPRQLPVPMDWNGKKFVEFVNWWDNESDPQLNSNVYQVAQELVQKHFPGEFGSELLQQKIVAAILQLTALKEEKDTVAPCKGSKWNAEEASKIILSGFQRQSIHKEELSKSEAEQQVKKRIEENAPHQQAKRSMEVSGKPASRPGIRSSADGSPARTVAKRDEATSGKSSSPAPGTPPSSPKTPVGSSGEPSTLKPDSPMSASKTSGEKKIRIVAPGGHSETVTLTEELTFPQLQEVIHKATQVPPQQQKLRLGFPPKILLPPDPGEEDQVVPLNHGDKINVESVGFVGQAPPKPGQTTKPSHHTSVRGHVDDHRPSEEAMLNALAARDTGGDAIDRAIVALLFFAESQGSDLWTTVQKQPHHFSVDGLFYRKAQKDLKPVEGQHIRFPAFPGKIFVYNAKLDRLELCLGELGHFEIEPDVEQNAQEGGHRLGGQGHGHHSQSVSGHSESAALDPHVKLKNETWFTSSGATFGSSGAVTKKSSSVKRIFGGQGHTLRGSSRETVMPQELPDMTGSIRGAAQRLQQFCDPEHNQSSIEEKPEGMEVGDNDGDAGGQGDGTAEPKYIRKGPGFSVLEPQAPDAHAAEALQLLQNLHNTLADSNHMDSDTDREEQIVTGDLSMELQPVENVNTVEEDRPETDQLDGLETAATV